MAFESDKVAAAGAGINAGPVDGEYPKPGTENPPGWSPCRHTGHRLDEMEVIGSRLADYLSFKGNGGGRRFCRPRVFHSVGRPITQCGRQLLAAFISYIYFHVPRLCRICVTRDDRSSRTAITCGAFASRRRRTTSATRVLSSLHRSWRVRIRFWRVEYHSRSLQSKAVRRLKREACRQEIHVLGVFSVSFSMDQPVLWAFLFP